jgi:hypothetical protein
MGQMVYVLMSLESGSNKKVKEWRPVAVVSNPDIAAQWYEYGANVDWVPLELDDVQQISPESMPSFQPRKTSPGEERAIELGKQMEATITRMETIINDQNKVIKQLQRTNKRGSNFKSVLLAKADESIPPKPQDGPHPFPEQLDAQGLADYIETYAGYDVDPEFVYEQFRDKSATLQLVPIDSLEEGGRDHNLQSKKNENLYLKQSLKTQPPAVVENGKVLDGNHRLRANVRRGLTHMWCYVVMDGD